MYPLRQNQDAAPRLHYCFLAPPPLSLRPLPSLISNCLNLPFATQGRPWRLESVPYKQATVDTESLPCPGAPQGPAQFHYPLSFLISHHFPLHHSLLDTRTSLLFFDQTTLCPTSGPLHLLFPVPGMLFPMACSLGYSSSPYHPRPWQPPIYFMSLCLCLHWAFHINGIIQFVLSCDWLLSLRN